jgi:Luciferase-like monooxygenase
MHSVQRARPAVFDPLETLTHVAAHTRTIRLGTSVINTLFHVPVVLARPSPAPSWSGASAAPTFPTNPAQPAGTADCRQTRVTTPSEEAISPAQLTSRTLSVLSSFTGSPVG